MTHYNRQTETNLKYNSNDYMTKDTFNGLRVNDKLATLYFMTSLSESAPSYRKVSSVHCPINHHVIVDVLGQLWFMEDFTITTITCTDAAGNWGSDSIVVNYTPPSSFRVGPVGGIISGGSIR
jgi:hypothetical protein